MLNPNEIKYTLPAVDTTECERQFDAAIQAASRSSQWPAVVRASRDGATTEQIRGTIRLYRLAGWTVSEGTGDCRAVIWHPECPESQSEGGRQGYRA